MSKILCKFHDDTNPSMHVYNNDGVMKGYCFTCSANVTLEPGELEGVIVGPTKPYQEPIDLNKRIEQIKQLPKDIIRGLELHYDLLGYYILWPDNSYYKRRNFEGKSRYIGPKGVKPPLFVYPGRPDTLVVVEGELNAMSLYEAIGGNVGTIASPGSASEFMRHIKRYLGYKKIILVVDHDAAGIVYGVQCKNELLLKGKYVILTTVKTDFNEVLQTGGIQAVKLACKGV